MLIKDARSSNIKIQEEIRTQKEEEKEKQSPYNAQQQQPQLIKAVGQRQQINKNATGPRLYGIGSLGSRDRAESCILCKCPTGQSIYLFTKQAALQIP